MCPKLRHPTVSNGELLLLQVEPVRVAFPEPLSAKDIVRFVSGVHHSYAVLGMLHKFCALWVILIPAGA